MRCPSASCLGEQWELLERDLTKCDGLSESRNAANIPFARRKRLR
jgi:hypothetical protein